MKKIIAATIGICVFISMGSYAFAGDNLVQNPSFEQGDGNMPASWTSSAWDTKPGVSDFTYEKGDAHSGDMFATITNNSQNDARFTQVVSVKDNTSYKLSCWIKTENVGEGQGEKGANISIEGKLETSDDIKGTNGKWEYVEMYARTGKGVDSMKVTVGIGGYGAIDTGKASFDDVSVEEVDSIPAGAVVARLGDTGQVNPSMGGAAGSASPAGSPGKIVWYLIAAAAVIVAGALIYYFKYNKKIQDEPCGEETCTSEEGKECTEESDVENKEDYETESFKYDKEDLL